MIINTSPDFNFLSLKQKSVIESFEKGENILITGGAGTGKSYLLNFLKRNYSALGFEVTASTGVAAVNIGGSTIHSWSGIGFANMPVDRIVENLFSAKFSKVRARIRKTKILAIDEVSMISSNIFDILDSVLRAVRNNDKVMGGLQIVLFGDFLQLPPISRDNSAFDFCFNSKAFQELNLKTFVLEQVFRQNDEKFVKVLNNLRLGLIDEEDREILTSRLKAKDQIAAIKPTILTTHNYKVEKINDYELKKIPHSEVVYNANYFGSKDKIEFLKKNCLAPETLKLKVGAQVMMIKNTYQKDGIINGSLGVVKEFSAKKNYPVVEFANGKIITISPEEWLLEKYDEQKKELISEAGLEQIPLILSWAMTIHKSQGLTLDKISCDLSDSFSPGQVYVALSRARSLSGVFIESINFAKINSNRDAVKFYQNL
ncbi:MAG: AAA family ATPase [Rickettsiales bacterium]|nr:AAA family ATPase [Rickettsiales bacterium]